jgi:Fe2+ or Zn2+ uptake regulation protein
MSAGETEDFEKRMAAARAYWEANRSRMTLIRRIVCDVVFKTTQPFEVNWLLKEARRTDKLISMASVYRTIKGLRAAELVEEFHGTAGDGFYRLRPISQHSSSVILCKNCGRTIPVDDPCLPIREGAQAQKKGFKATHVRLQTEAICEEFERTGLCQKDCLPIRRQ